MDDDSYITEDCDSSHSSYSDKISSDLEAELYSVIHYENLSDLSFSAKSDLVNEDTKNITCVTHSVNQFVKPGKANTGFNFTTDFHHPTSNQDGCIEDFSRGVVKNNANYFSPPKKHESCSEQNSDSVILLSDNSEKNVKVLAKFRKNKRVFNNSLEENHNSNQDDLEKIPKGTVKDNANYTTAPTKQKSYSRESSDSVIIVSDDLEEKSIKMSTKIQSNKRVFNNSSGMKNSFQETYRDWDLSDSNDSIIWIENGDKSNNLQFNLLNDVDVDTISISSDSSGCISPLLLKKNRTSNCLSSAVKKGKYTDDLWYIDEEDRYRSKKGYRKSKEIICCNCCKKGHLARYCNVEKSMKCFICGGGHAAPQCENKVCGKCYNMGHDSRFCYTKPVSNCDLCNMLGHKMKDCPDHWRRYHLTTDPLHIVPGEPVSQNGTIYCFNCGYAGHIGSVCREPRILRSSAVTWPCVISYSNTNMFANKKNCQTNSNSVNNNIVKYEFPKPVQDFITERKNKKKGLVAEKNRKPKMWEIYKQRRIERKKKILAEREKDFPRTPKKSAAENPIYSIPESVHAKFKNQRRMQRKNFSKKNRIKREQHMETEICDREVKLENCDREVKLEICE